MTAVPDDAVLKMLSDREQRIVYEAGIALFADRLFWMRSRPSTTRHSPR